MTSRGQRLAPHAYRPLQKYLSLDRRVDKVCAMVSSTLLYTQSGVLRNGVRLDELH